MSTAEQWAEAFRGQSGGSFTLRFDRLGLEAQCRTLESEEVEECRAMGGERGMRYALYLACDALREAGEQLRAQGAVGTAFDVTRKLSYGDAVAAGQAILEKSGANQARVTLNAGGQSQPLTLSRVEESRNRQERMGNGSFWEERSSGGQQSGDRLIRDFADRLRAAAGNR